MPLDGMTRRARNVVIANNDFAAKDGTVLTSPTSFVAGMGLSNILNDRLKMVCRTIGNSVILDLDMGYPVPASLFMLLGHNFTAAARWRIRGARARSGAAGDVGGYNFALADTVYDTRGILASGTARGALSWTSTMLDHDLNSGTLPAGCTLTRASPGTYFDYTGTMRTAPAGEARFDYDPVTKAPLGLLVEEAATNLLLRSQELDDSVWLTINATRTANTAAAPDATNSADTLTATSGSGVVYQNVSIPANTSIYTASVFMRQGTASTTLLDLVFSGGLTYRASVNWSTLTVTAQNSATSADVSFISVSGGWYRLSVRGANTSNTLASFTIFPASTGTGSVVCWGAQLEVGSSPTNYIATTTASVTRAADVPTMPTSALPSFNAAAGTLIVTATGSATASGPVVAGFNGGSFSDTIYLWQASAGRIALTVRSGGSAQVDLDAAGVHTNTNIIGVSFAANDFGISVNGGAVASDLSGAIPTVTELHLGKAPWAVGSYLNGWISRITYIASRISNADLQTLTNPATSTATRAATLAPYAGTSGTTPITLGTGTKTVFVDDQGLRLYRGAAVQLAIDAGNYMRGPVTDYDRASGRLTVNVTSVVGSGSATSMTITREAADLSVWPSVDPFGLSYWGDFSWGGQIDLLGEGYSPPGVHMPGLANGDGQPVYARYFKIEVQDTSLSYLDIGRLVVAAAYQPTINMSWDWRIGWVDPSQRERSRGGQVYVDGRRQWRTASLQLANIPRTEMMSQMYELRRAVGVRKPFALILDPTDAANLHRLTLWGSIPDQSMEILNPQAGDYRTALNVEEHF